MQIVKTVTAGAFLLMSAGAMVAPVTAEDEPKANIIQAYVFHIKPGEAQEFNEGFKAWWACYGENGGKETWSAWTPHSGRLNQVAFRSTAQTWSAYDETDRSGNECMATWQEKVEPHFYGMEAEYQARWDDASNTDNMGDMEVNVVLVREFDFKDTGKAHKLAKKFKAGAEAGGIKPYVFHSHVTGDGEFDVSLAILRPDYAGFMDDGSDFWKAQADHHGEEEAEKMQKKWADNVVTVNARMWKRNKGLSYAPKK